MNTLIFTVLLHGVLYCAGAFAQKENDQLEALKTAVEEAKLVVSKNYEYANLGNAIAIDGTTAVVAAYRDDNVANSDGSVYVYEFDGSDWIQAHQLNASNGSDGDNFGSGVAIDGDLIMVGAVQHDLSGAVYVFEFDGMNWNETQILTPSSPTSTNYIRFGDSISLSSGRLIVGARSDPEVGGAAYVFEDDGNNWVQTQKLTASDGVVQDNFGWSVDVFGFTAVIGATQTGDGVIRDGSVYVFKLNQNNNTWEETQILNASDPQDNLYFGDSIEVNGSHLIVGSRDATSGFNTGAAYSFTYDGINDEWVFAQKFTGSDTTGGDHFSTGMSLDGDTLAVGAFQDGEAGIANSAGSVFIFEFQDPNWVEVQKIMPAGLEYQDAFGIAVAMDEVNDRLFIGAYGDDDVANDAGAAFVYDLNVSTWEQSQKLLAIDSAVDDNFASAVDIDGNMAVVGASGDNDFGSNSGAVYVFSYNGISWNLDQKLFPNDPAASNFFGSSVGISGDWLAVAAHVPSSGFVYLFENVGGIWQQQQKLTSSDGVAGDFFGRSLEINGSRLIVGASFDDDAGSSSGSAYVFDEAGGVWSEMDKLVADDAAAGDYFGHSVAIDGDRALVGSWSADTSISNTGAAYVFEYNAPDWVQVDKFIPSDPYGNGFFGFDVALQNNWAMVGAHGDDDLANESGAVYVYKLDNNVWTELQKLTAAAGSSFDRLGRNIDLDGLRMVAGASGRDTAGSNAGSVFSYEFNGVNWSFDQELTASDGADNDLFGSVVGISGNRVIAGAPKDDNNWIDDGAAYVNNIANRYDLIVNVVGLYPGASIGNSHRSPNTITLSNAGDSVNFIGGQVAQQVISNLADGEPYNLMFSGNPTFPDQTCTFDNPVTTGTINGSDVVYTLTCVAVKYSLGINGFYLATGTEAVVENHLGEQITIQPGNVVTDFSGLVDDGSVYQVSVITQPTNPSQTCAFFNNGLGFMNGDTTVWIDCAIDQFTIGGNVSGLLAGNELVLQNNDGDDLIITDNGDFAFATALDDLSAYEVTITQQPNGPIQTCTINNDQGALNGANITNVQIDCLMGNDLIFQDGFE